MRTRIAIAGQDVRFLDSLRAILRDAGYLVVEPEVADYAVIQIGGTTPGVRISEVSRGGNNDGGLSRFLPAPLSAPAVLTALLRIAKPRDAIIGRATPHRY